MLFDRVLQVPTYFKTNKKTVLCIKNILTQIPMYQFETSDPACLINNKFIKSSRKVNAPKKVTALRSHIYINLHTQNVDFALYKFLALLYLSVSKFPSAEYVALTQNRANSMAPSVCVYPGPCVP